MKGRESFSRWLIKGGTFIIGWGLAIAPWLLGTTPNWAQIVLDCILIVGSILLLSGKFLSNQSYRIIPRGKLWNWIGILNLLILIWFASAVLNWAGIWDEQSNEFIKIRTAIPFLPTTYHRPASELAFLNILALSFMFWAIVNLFRPSLNKIFTAQSQQKTKSAIDHIPQATHLRRLLAPLAWSCILLVLIGIVQRLTQTEKLLWLVDDGRGYISHFGPYPYRSNAAQFLNILWPIFFVVASRLITLPSAADRFRGIFYGIVAMISFVGVAASASRGGALVSGLIFITLVPGIIITLLIHGHKRSASLLGLFTTGSIIFSIPLGGMLWERFEKIPDIIPTLLPPRTQTFAVEWMMIASTNRPFTLIQMYAPPSEDGLLGVHLRSDDTIYISVRSIATTNKTISYMIGKLPQLDGSRFHFVLNCTPDKLLLYANGITIGELPLEKIWNFKDRVLPIYALSLNPTGKPSDETSYLRIAFYNTYLPEHIAIQLSDISLAPVPGLPKPVLELPLYDLDKISLRLKLGLLGRRVIWEYTKNMLGNYPAWCGAGPGTFSQLYKRHAPYLELVDPHVHQDILEIRFNLGWIGSILIILLGLFVFILPFPDGLSERTVWGCYAAIIGCYIHSLADFPLHNISVLSALVLISAITPWLPMVFPKAKRVIKTNELTTLLHFEK